MYNFVLFIAYYACCSKALSCHPVLRSSMELASLVETDALMTQRHPDRFWT